MISKTLETALNRQVNRELFSAYLYLSMSSHFEAAHQKGFAKWMRLQAKEEEMHAFRIYDFILARNGRIALQEIEAPKSSWASPEEVFADTYAHEQKVTGMINGLVEIAQKEKDPAAFVMLQWFVKEQVEEEENASTILNRIRELGDDAGRLAALDQELGKRK